MLSAVKRVALARKAEARQRRLTETHTCAGEQSQQQRTFRKHVAFPFTGPFTTTWSTSQPRNKVRAIALWLGLKKRSEKPSRRHQRERKPQRNWLNTLSKRRPENNSQNANVGKRLPAFLDTDQKTNTNNCQTPTPKSFAKKCSFPAFLFFGCGITVATVVQQLFNTCFVFLALPFPDPPVLQYCLSSFLSSPLVLCRCLCSYLCLLSLLRILLYSPLCLL